MDFFKKLDNRSLGKYKVGRRNKPTRVELLFDIDDFQNAVELQGSKSLEAGLKALKEQKKLEAVVHSYLLRPDFKVEIALPQDFSFRDNDRLKSWLDTIPF